MTDLVPVPIERIKRTIKDTFNLDFMSGAHVDVTSLPIQIQFEYQELLDELFKKLNQLLEKMITWTSSMLGTAEGMITDTLEQFSEIADRILDNIDAKYKDNLKLTFNEIQKIRQALVDDINSTIGTVNRMIEDRINQIFKSVLELLQKATELVEQVFSSAEELIDKFHTDMIKPIFDRLDGIETQFFQDVNMLLTRLFDERSRTFIEAREYIDKLRKIISDPLLLFDPIARQCREETAGMGGPFAFLEDDEVYEVNKCLRQRRLAEDIEISTIADFGRIYAALQYEAFLFMVMHSVVSGLPGIDGTRNRYTKEWTDFDQLCRIWLDFEKVVS